MDNPRFAENLRALIGTERGAQQRLADDIGVSPGTVTAWLQGREPGKRLQRVLSEHFSVSRDRLLFGVVH